MAANTIIYVFLSASVLSFAAAWAKKDAISSSSSVLNRTSSLDPQGFSGYGAGSLNRCDKCGVRGGSQNPDVRIINGTDAEVGEFPWKCYERITLDNGWFGVCTCNILSPEWVLVAAHCVHNLSVSRITISADLSFVNVADYIVHEGWDTNTLVNGSSLDFRDPSTGRYYAIGITSWVFEPCSTQDFPNVFADVTKYLDWIDNKTGTHFCG